MSKPLPKPESSVVDPAVELAKAQESLKAAREAVKVAKAKAKATKKPRVSVWEQAGRILANPENCQNGKPADSALAELQIATGKESKTHEQTIKRAFEVVRGFRAVEASAK